MAFGIFLEGDVDDGDAASDADLRRGEADAVGGVHGLEHVVDELLQFVVEDSHGLGGLFENRDCRILRWDRSSVIFQLLAVALEVASGFGHGIAAEFFQSAAGEGERDHGLGRNSGGGHDTDIGALVGGFDRLARGEIDRLQRAAQAWKSVSR